MQWPLFEGLPDADVRRLLDAARRRRFERGVVVFHEGEAADSVHLVASGRLAVRVTTPSGDTVTVNIVGAGGFFGELALLQVGRPAHRTATVVALEVSETLALPGSSFRELCRSNPSVEHLLVTMLARRVEELSGRLLESLYVGLDRRLNRRLLELARLYGDDATPGPITLPLTQDHLADLVGGTRPSVNQALQRLVEQGVVELGRGRTVVLDLPALTHKAAL